MLIEGYNIEENTQENAYQIEIEKLTKNRPTNGREYGSETTT